MLTFQLDDNNDFVLDSNYNLVMSTGKDAIATTAKNYAMTRKGEMIHNMTEGIPFFDSSFRERMNLIQFRHSLRKRLASVPGVKRISSLNIRQVGNVLKYTATLVTVEGEVNVNG